MKESCELIFSVAPSPVSLRNFPPSVICKSCHMLEQTIVSFFKTLVSLLLGTLRKIELTLLQFNCILTANKTRTGLEVKKLK